MLVGQIMILYNVDYKTDVAHYCKKYIHVRKI